jgi:membrane-associated phospholipid phosphatase
MMSRDSAEKSALIVFTALSAVAVMGWCGLSFPPADLFNPFGIALLLGGATVYYRRRGADTFVLCLSALLQITLFSACYSVLMYSLAALGRPYIDAPLATFDRALGVSLPSIVAWSAGHPTVNQALQVAYNSLLWQTPLVLILLGFTGDRPRLEGFVRQFMLCTLACACVFAIAPAEGPFAVYDYAPSPTQAVYLQHLHSLREGTRTVISWRGAEGLITFPSFHTGWAILLAWSLRRWKWVFFPALLLNAAVILSTLTTGWHYFADVVAGAAAAAASIAVSAAWVRSPSLSTAPRLGGCVPAVAVE